MKQAPSKRIQAEDSANATLCRFEDISGRIAGQSLDCSGRRNLELAGGIASNLRGTLANPSASLESIQWLAADLDWRCDRLERSLSR